MSRIEIGRAPELCQIEAKEAARLVELSSPKPEARYWVASKGQVAVMTTSEVAELLKTDPTLQLMPEDQSIKEWRGAAEYGFIATMSNLTAGVEVPLTVVDDALQFGELEVLPDAVLDSYLRSVNMVKDQDPTPLRNVMLKMLQDSGVTIQEVISPKGE